MFLSFFVTGFRHRVWARCSELFWRVSRSLRPVTQQFPRVDSDAYDTTLRQRRLLERITSDAEPKPELIPCVRVVEFLFQRFLFCVCDVLWCGAV